MACQSCAAEKAAIKDGTTSGDGGNGQEEPDSPDRPNILLILLDDVGYSDFGCYGSEISTPNIDRLAAQGVRTRCFYNQARSAPTRASLLTGLYPHQVGYGSLKVLSYPAYQGYVNESNAMIPEVLESAGYFSVMTGKWHLGFGKGVTPIGRGFDRSLDSAAGELYFWNDNTGKTLHWNEKKISLTDDRLPAGWYSSDLWAEIGLRFIQEARYQKNGRPLSMASSMYASPLSVQRLVEYQSRGRKGSSNGICTSLRKRRFLDNSCRVLAVVSDEK